jgi:hypothetical protein
MSQEQRCPDCNEIIIRHQGGGEECGCTRRCKLSDNDLFHARLKVTTHFIVDLAFEPQPHGLTTLRMLQESITAVIRLLEPDTLTLQLTTGDTPLNLGQQATALVIETSSKTGNSFPISNFADLQFSSGDSTIATITANGDGTATVTPVAVGSTVLSCKDTSNGLTGTVGVTVTAAVADAPDTLSLTLSPPFPAGTSGNAPKAAVSGAKPV